jgi:hypothetical protein
MEVLHRIGGDIGIGSIAGSAVGTGIGIRKTLVALASAIGIGSPFAGRDAVGASAIFSAKSHRQRLGKSDVIIMAEIKVGGPFTVGELPVEKIALQAIERCSAQRLERSEQSGVRRIECL